MEKEVTFRAGYVGIIGRPNVGKSTLLNVILGEKLAAVTPKPQTTRHRIMGIFTDEDTQMIFLDTPGILTPRYQLHKAMVECVNRVIKEADIILLIVEPYEPHEIEFKVIEKLKSTQQPKILLINKIDTIHKEKLLPLIECYANMDVFCEIIPISALKNNGIDRIIKVIKNILPESPPLYPPDILTEHPERFFVAEIIREKIFKYFRQEIPYSATVTIEEFKERDNAKDYIHAIIYVERESQQGILIGKKGTGLKKISVEARKEIEAFLGREVYLELWVKVRKDWRKSTKDLKEFGYIGQQFSL